MEPLTALSVAGTIVQFVDFGIKLFCEGREIYASGRGTLSANDDVERITTYLQKDVACLRESVWSTNPAFPLTEQEHELRRTLEKICDDVATVAEALLDRLEKLKVKGAQGRKWKSFQQVVRVAWSKPEISSLKKQFADFKEALETRVLLSIRSNVDSQSIRASEHFETLDRSSRRMISLLVSTEEMLQTILLSGHEMRDKTTNLITLVKNLDHINQQEHERTRRMVAGERARRQTGDTFDSPSGDIEEIMAMILDVSPVQQSMARKSAHKSIIRSLQYPMMSSRYEDLQEAYPKTFDWIFEDSKASQLPWDNLGEWLKTGKGVYWVSGKAGSGKSTLMKYMFDDPRTRQFLSIWAGGSSEVKFCVATFFFWNSGTPEQQSQTGLLRALLFQIFSAHPDLVPLLLPDLWARSNANWISDKPGDFVESWPIKKLLETFKALLHQRSIPLRLFLLIDGLDEFDGDPENIAELLTEITEMTDAQNVKVCLSSRPWVVFEDYFRQYPKLRLQDLTQGDIDHYVHDNFRRNRAFQELEIKEPESAPRLLRDVVKKADGVFLWVRIVVKSLLEGIRNRDDMAILHERLDILPPELEPLYEHLLSRIEPIYMQWASEAFQILRVCRELFFDPFSNPNRRRGPNTAVAPLTISTLLFAIDDNLNITTMKGKDHRMLHPRYEDTVVQLTARCAGFLEVPKFLQISDTSLKVRKHDAVVQYLHRTVRDFLEKKRRWSILLTYTAKTNFDPYFCMMKATVLHLSLRYTETSKNDGKYDSNRSYSFDHSDSSSGLDIIKAVSKGFMILAYYADSHAETHDDQAAIIDKLDELLTREAVSTDQHWCDRLLYRQNSFSDTKLLELATFCGLSGYISQKLAQLDRQTSSSGASCLLSALLRVQDWHPDASIPPLRPEVVSSLLQHGADPNKLFGVSNDVHSTPWGSALYYVWRAGTQFTHRLKPEYIQVMKLLAQWGANPRAAIRIPSEERQFSAVEIITNYLTPRFPLEAAGLLQELERDPAAPRRRRGQSESEQDLHSSRQQKMRRIT